MNPTQRGTATAISAPFHIASLGQHINQIPAPIANRPSNSSSFSRHHNHDLDNVESSRPPSIRLQTILLRSGLYTWADPQGLRCTGLNPFILPTLNIVMLQPNFVFSAKSVSVELSGIANFKQNVVHHHKLIKKVCKTIESNSPLKQIR